MILITLISADTVTDLITGSIFVCKKAFFAFLLTRLAACISISCSVFLLETIFKICEPVPVFAGD